MLQLFVKKILAINKNKIFYSLIVVLIVVLGSFFRLSYLDWDEHHYLHPDERLYINASNMSLPHSLPEFLSVNSPLNPHMFYYGSFPLYIYLSFQWLYKTLFSVNINLLVLSRFISALLSSLSIIIIYRIAKKIISEKGAIFAVFLYAFSIGSIQYAHFNTTESLLTFLNLLILWVSLIFIERIKFHRSMHLKAVIIIGILVGLSAATKITGLSFGLTPFAAFAIFLLKNRKNNLKRNAIYLFMLGIILVVIASITAFLGAPYNLIDITSFNREQEYMQGVILGKYKPPFTIIYENTIPYIYQITQILPWIFSPLALMLSFVGFIAVLKKSFSKNYRLLLILVWPVVYFAAAGKWYTKFTRYMVPLIPYFSLYAAYIINKLIESRYKKLYSVIILIIFFTHLSLSLNFISEIYQNRHTRISASKWIYENIPFKSTVAFEHWDDRLPLPVDGNIPEFYNFLELKVYEPDTEAKILNISTNLSEADYIILSSRRVFYSIIRNPNQYLFTSNLYKLLLSNKLGYRLIHLEKRLFTFGGIKIDDDIADESFQSYDHPPVYIFKNVSHLTPEKLFNLITNNRL